MAINTTTFTPPIYLATKDDPLVTFTWRNCQGHPDDMGLVEGNLTNLHVPADARPSDGTDAEMTIYNIDTGEYTDTWRTRYVDGRWSACWGGTIRQAWANPGVFPHPFGTTASGLPLEPGTIKAVELEAGEINHVVGVVLPRDAVDREPTLPATRTDGRGDGPHLIAQGQMMRLPADLDLDALQLSPVARVVAEAAQEYGLMVWDSGEGITLRAENAQSLAADPYAEIFGETHPALALWGDPERGEQPFPVGRLQVLQRGFVSGGLPDMQGLVEDAQ